MKSKRDLRLLAVVVVLLAIPLLWVWWSSRDVEKRRETTLAGVPQFPAPHQPPRRRPSPVDPSARPPPPQAPIRPIAKHDPMTSFVLQPAPVAGLIQVNALFNTPLFDRLRECFPRQFGALDQLNGALGIDVTRDVDRFGIVPDGVAMSGFFEGKPVAQTMAGPDSSSEEYRGATIWSAHDRCGAQMGNLVVTASKSDDCRAMVDRALAPAPANAADQLYGDIFLRTDLAPFREDAAPELRALVESLDGLTFRANVWDSVAVSVEGAPRAGRSVADLEQMAKGAISVLKGQIDEDQVELRTLADLAKVSTDSGKLQIDLALPAQDLFDRFKIPCESRDAGP
jgi:hypothetical protein